MKDVGHLSFNYTKLDLVGKNLIDLEALPKYTALQLLDVSQNELTSVDQLSKCSNLLSVKIDQNQISSLDGLMATIGAGEPMDSLQNLSIKGNKLSGVPSALPLPMLLYVNLDQNELTTLSGTFTVATKLTKLEARENKLTTTAGIEELEDLEEAHFSTNEITELVLGANPNLKVLALNGNQISSLASFAGNAPNLETLDMSQNPTLGEAEGFNFATEVAHLSGLTRLKTLSFAESPVTGADKYRNHVHAVLPHLESLDGEPFSEEDREPPPAPVEEAPADE